MKDAWSGLPDLPTRPTLSKLAVYQVFTIPADIATTTVNNQPGFWLRIRLVSGGFTRSNTIQWTDQGSATIC